MRKRIAALIVAAFSVMVFAGFSLLSDGQINRPVINNPKGKLNSVTFTISGSKDADGYTVRCAPDSSFEKGLKTKVIKGNGKKTQTVTVTSLVPGKTYHLKVKAWEETLSGGKEFSKYSDVKTVKTLSYSQRARQIMKKMSLKEKVSQMLFVYVPSKDAAKKAKKYQYGGYLLFYYNVDGKTKKQVKAMTGKFQKVSKIDMFIAADEEGGDVVRLSSNRKLGHSRFKSPRALYKSGGYEKIVKDTKSKDSFLLSYGVNTNFAPVADLPYSKKNFIYSRSFSTKAKPTAKYIKLVVERMNKDGVVSCLKHYPGYGNNTDTHTDLARDNRKLSVFKKRDLVPFRQGIKSGCSMIMVNHNIVKAFDKKMPASISAPVHKYLRKTLKYDGIIITDGMDMQGVRKYGKNNAALAVKAVKAGNDMICTPYGSTSRKAIVTAVKKGKIKKSRIDRSVERILIVKLKNGIIK